MSGHDATTAPVRVELDGGVLRVTLERPRARNALDEATIAALGHAFSVRAHEEGVRCVVLRGADPAFCAGLDRATLASLAGDAARIREHGPRLQSVIGAIAECPRPTLAGVQGACLGGGMALLLACDLRVAATDAFFSMMEMRYAFLPDLGQIHRLQREVGMARAKEMLFIGDRFDAATMLGWGVLNQVVPKAELGTAVERWAQRLVEAPPLAVRAAKRILHAHPGGADGDASQRDALEANAAGLIGSADFHEGLAAVAEARQPRFEGR
ncbi:MAG TPA: enoyl-CoA hydratase/isomerase family protein [Candidatus Dormibacteraeota bacterium]|nr:enoyl-CoA hydratase/isomerase family protein [Candidatus Dormibacteraeota bacterium]